MSNGLKRSGFAQKARKPMKRAWIATKPKQGRKALIAQADGMIQAVVLARDKYVCQKCGGKAHEGHHIIHRRNLALRWATRNVVSLCRSCHGMEGTAQRWKLDEFIIKWVGSIEAYEALRLYGNTQPGEDPEDAITRLQKVLDK